MASILPSAPGAKKRPGDKRSQRARALAVIERMAGGISMRKAALAEGLDNSSLQQVLRKDDELRAAYALAIAAGADARRERLSEEADRVMAVAKKGGHGASAYVSAFATKVRIVQWDAEKLLPKKYGAKIDHTLGGPNGEPIAFTEVRRTVVDPAKV